MLILRKRKRGLGTGECQHVYVAVAEGTRQWLPVGQAGLPVAIAPLIFCVVVTAVGRRPNQAGYVAWRIDLRFLVEHVIERHDLLADAIADEIGFIYIVLEPVEREVIDGLNVAALPRPAEGLVAPRGSGGVDIAGRGAGPLVEIRQVVRDATRTPSVGHLRRERRGGDGQDWYLLLRCGHYCQVLISSVETHVCKVPLVKVCRYHAPLT